MATQETVTYSNDSAFHALDLHDADDLQLRADLIAALAAIVKERKLTQVMAGELLSMDQPRISALMNGKINLFSTARLLKALGDIGCDVEVRIARSESGKGRLRVAA